LEEIDQHGQIKVHPIDEVISLGKESHARLHAHVNDATGLLSNGIMDLVVIDSPGLNTDSAKTTAIFAKQKHIDAIIFVVNSENHFTQSVTIYTISSSNDF
jgi:mitofusin